MTKEQHARQTEKRRSLGLCLACGKPATPRVNCKPCTQKSVEWYRAHPRRRPKRTKQED